MSLIRPYRGNVSLAGLGPGHLLAFLLLLLLWLVPLWCFAAAPNLTIDSPKDGARIVQEQDTILVSGKVSSVDEQASNADILFVLDVSGSTAHYAGVDFDDADLPRSKPRLGGWSSGVNVFGGGFGMRPRPMTVDLHNSILAAEIAATRRLLRQLNTDTTRVGLITFGETAELFEPLTHQFDRIDKSLEEVFEIGPKGGTHMVGGIRLGIRELSGLGHSKARPNAVKVQFLLTDGFPTLPIGGGNRASAEDTNLAINAARIAAKARIKIHTFALGEEALSYPRAAVGVAKKSGGTFTPVSRPADILAILEKISVVGVDYVEVTNQTSGEKAFQTRLAADGFFAAAVPMRTGRNKIQVMARSATGGITTKTVTVDYRPGGQRSMDLEVFLEKEKTLRRGIEKLESKNN